MPARYPQRFDQYILLHPLGSGGMGRVFLALAGQEGMETFVVIKRMLPGLLERPDQVERFRHEADLARRLVHGNLVHTHAVGEVNGEAFIVQEHIDGQDVMALLEKLAGERRKLPVEVSLYIAASVARGLEYAHDFQKLGLVHRDINPPNVRLTYDGEVKLLDFGIALSNLQGDEAVRNKPVGKLAYMAPEQISGDGVNRRTDLYAVGVLLWELLTGHPLGTTLENGEVVVPEDSRDDAFKQVLRGQFLKPSTFNPKVPAAIDSIVLNLLSRNPGDRPESAAIVRASLMRHLPPGYNAEQALAHEMLRLFPRELERAERERLTMEARALAPLLLPAALPARPPQPGDGTGSKRWTVVITGAVVVAAIALAVVFFIEHDGPTPPDNKIVGAATPRPPAAVEHSLRPSPAAPSPPPIPVAEPVPAPPVPVPTSARHAVANGRATTRASISMAQKGSRPEPASGSAENDPGAKDLASARDAFHDREWKTAIDLAKRAAREGGGAEAHALLGATYFKMEKYEDAEREYVTALKLDPSDNRLPKLLDLVRQTKAQSLSKAP